MLEKYLNIFLVIFLIVSITPNAAFATSSLKDFSDGALPVKDNNFDKQQNNTTATNENSKHSLSRYGIKLDNSKPDNSQYDKDNKSENDLLNALNHRLENEFLNLKGDENISLTKVIEILNNYKIKSIFTNKSIEKLEKGDIILIRMSKDDKHIEFVKITGIIKNNNGNLTKITFILNGNTREYTVDGLKKLYMNLGIGVTPADTGVKLTSNNINENQTSKPKTVVYTGTNQRYLNQDTWDDIKEVARNTWNKIKQKSTDTWNTIKETSNEGWNKIKQTWFYKNLDKILWITGGTVLAVGLGVAVVKYTPIMNRISNWWHGTNKAPIPIEQVAVDETEVEPFQNDIPEEVVSPSTLKSTKSAYYDVYVDSLGKPPLKIQIGRTLKNGADNGYFEYYQPKYYDNFGGLIILRATPETSSDVQANLPPTQILVEFTDYGMPETPGEKILLNEFIWKQRGWNSWSAEGTYTLNNNILFLRATRVY